MCQFLSPRIPFILIPKIEFMGLSFLLGLMYKLVFIQLLQNWNPEDTFWATIFCKGKTYLHSKTHLILDHQSSHTVHMFLTCTFPQSKPKTRKWILEDLVNGLLPNCLVNCLVLCLPVFSMTFMNTTWSSIMFCFLCQGNACKDWYCPTLARLKTTPSAAGQVW